MYQGLDAFFLRFLLFRMLTLINIKLLICLALAAKVTTFSMLQFPVLNYSTDFKTNLASLKFEE